ncbi:hypothetical protein BN439_3885 [Erwinia amylovora Ea644]|nr:hypothetical protein BN439_3885 [Erwinia amylovora Ea644]CCP08988.1 hypothetical protein BN440_4004 [Erwinia amylovora MR1]
MLIITAEECPQRVMVAGARGQLPAARPPPDSGEHR